MRQDIEAGGRWGRWGRWKPAFRADLPPGSEATKDDLVKNQVDNVPAAVINAGLLCMSALGHENARLAQDVAQP